MLNTYCKSFDNNNFADTIELNQSLIIYAISSTRKNRKLWEFEIGTYFNFPIYFSEHLFFIIVFTGVSNDETHMAPPWKSMMTSKPVWAIIIAHFSENWGFYTLLTGMPTFMKDVLGYKLDQAGFLAAFPYLLMAGIVQSAGILGKNLSKRKINSPKF